MTDSMLSRFVTARRSYIASQFSGLNSKQLEAVLEEKKNVLLEDAAALTDGGCVVG